MLKKGGLSKLIVRTFKETFLIVLGIISAGFGLKGFLIPNGFIDGGVTGISLLIHFLTPISISILLLIINLPFIFLAIKQIDRNFALKTFIAILGLSLSILIINYPTITSDKLLASVFGGFLMGAGIGLSVRGGCVLDGTEVFAVYINRKLSISIGEVVFILNIIIFSFAAFLLGIESALYSILTYLVAFKTVDFFIQGIEEYIGITIISKENEKIRNKLVKELGKGVTVYRGKSGFADLENSQEKNILFTIITRLEVSKIKHEIISIDSSAVIIEQSIKEVRGGIIKKRPLH